MVNSFTSLLLTYICPLCNRDLYSYATFPAAKERFLTSCEFRFTKPVYIVGT